MAASVALVPSLWAAPDEPAAEAAETAPPAASAVERAAKIVIAGREVSYRTTVGKITLQKDDGTPRAAVFHVSYVRTDVDAAAARPVMFAFNGGPVWGRKS
ncbi:MAG: hypothetical protein MUF04_15155 [Akkermansiaceae bacterium]|nr:hypothetical protein [Akkermansiaceae bacterium]